MGAKTVQVADIDGDAHTILQARALRLRNQLDIEQCLTNARLGIFYQCIGRGIDALHAGDKDEVARSRAETPGPSALIAPGGLRVLTPFGDCDCANSRAKAIINAVTPARTNRCNIGHSLPMIGSMLRPQILRWI
jgi:hypothetical protein